MWRAYNADKSNPRDIYVNTAPWVNGYPTHNVRFAVNSASFLTVNGPFDAGGQADNTISDGSAHIEISFGKLDTGLTAVTGWARVTTNAAADYMACAWVDPGPAAGPPRIGLSTDTLWFTAVKGGANPDSQVVQVNNTGGGTLTNVTTAGAASWLSVNRRGAGNAQRLVNDVTLGSLDTGTYQATVTVSGDGASTGASYAVRLRVVLAPRQLTSLTVSPDSTGLAPSGTARFTATPKDQYGAAFAAAISWSATGGGTVSPASSAAAVVTHTTTFTSNGAEGTFLVIASSGNFKDTARATVTKDLVKSITMTAPSGGAVYRVGDLMHVVWSASAAVGGVMITISPDKGRTWGYVAANSIDRVNPSWGDFAWTIAPTVTPRATGALMSVVSDSVLVQVSDYVDANVKAMPSSPLSIKDPAEVTARAEAGGPAALILRAGTGRLRVSVPWRQAFRIVVRDVRGKEMMKIEGSGPRECAVDGVVPGVYTVTIAAPGHVVVRRVFVGR